MARKNTKFLYFLLSIGLVLIVMGGVKYIPGLQAVGDLGGDVIFTGYNDYDDRINSPILYKSNYRIEPNTPMVGFKHDTTLPGPYIVCGENTCGQSQTSTDQWGCAVYGGGSCSGGSCCRYGSSASQNYWYCKGVQKGVCDNTNFCKGDGCIMDNSARTNPPSCSTRPSCGGRIISDEVYDCKENTCDGVETGEDTYGCMTYKKTTTTYPTASCAGRLYYKKCGCTGQPCSGNICSCPSVTTTVNCGGAGTSTCQGDDCKVKGNYNGEYRTWTLTSPLKTLTEWKIENPDKLELITGASVCPASLTHYEDDYWIYEGSSGSNWGDDRCTRATVNLPKSSGPLKISGSSNKHVTGSGNWALGPNPSSTLTTAQSMRSADGLVKDIKIIATCTGGYSASTGESGSTGTIGPICSVKIGNNAFSIKHEETLIELFASKINPDVSEVWLNGRYDKTISFSGLDNVNVSFTASGGSPTLDIKEFGFLLPFSCTQGPEELLGVETFAGPRSLSIYDLRYSPTKFCLDHPTIITSETGSGSTTTNEIYNQLRRGDVVEIPATQTWTMFYIFYNSGDISMVCPEGAFDVERNKCVNTTGVVFFCSEGTFDPAYGSCVVTPDIKPVCPYGRYDVVQDICIYSIPVHGVCEIGDYNSQTGKCEYPLEDEECSNKFILNEITDMCEKYPVAIIACEPTFSFNPVSGYCEKEVENFILCEGDYDEETGLCTKTIVPTIERVCPDDSTLFQDSEGRYSCLSEPDFVTGDCVQGSWDIEKNACVIKPNLEYLCINGEISDDGESCVIIPTTRIICPSDTTYDLDIEMCVDKKGVSCPNGAFWSSIKDRCVASNDIILCPENSEYDSEKGICVRDLIVIPDITNPFDFNFSSSFIGLIIGIALTLFVLFILFTNPKKR